MQYGFMNLLWLAKIELCVHFFSSIIHPLEVIRLIYERVKAHGKCFVLTEEQQNNSFAEALASRISKHCFQWLDAPVEVLGALNLPAVPMNIELEKAMLPNSEKVTERLVKLLAV